MLCSAYQAMEWAPVASIIDALDEAFYLAIENVEPTGKRIYLALDPSGCMQNSCSRMPYCVAMASATLAMVFARREPNCIIWPRTIRSGTWTSRGSTARPGL